VDALGQHREPLHVALVEEVQVAAPHELGGQPGRHDRSGARDGDAALRARGEVGEHLLRRLAVVTREGLVHRRHPHSIGQLEVAHLDGAGDRLELLLGELLGLGHRSSSFEDFLIIERILIY
jgi:hypothetical protein